MEKNRNYSNSYDERNRSDILKLRERHGRIAAYGRWEIFKQILLDEDGRIDLNCSESVAILRRELDLNPLKKLEDFLESCADFGLIDEEIYRNLNAAVSSDIKETLDYKQEMSERARGKEDIDAEACS